jgi:hypothetical protein
VTDWWDDMARTVEAAGHDRHSASWHAAMRDLHAERFPQADKRSRDNMRLIAEWAAARESA